MHDKAVFLDKDGTLVENVPYNVDPRRIELVPRAAEALHLLDALGYRLFVISNQPGVAMGCFSSDALGRVESKLRELLDARGIPLGGFYYCPHHPHGNVPEFSRRCNCRKPAPGLLLRAADEHEIDLGASWFVGDILDDIEAGNRAGCRTILVDRGGETEWRLSPLREPRFVVGDLPMAAEWIAAAANQETLRSAPNALAAQEAC